MGEINKQKRQVQSKQKSTYIYHIATKIKQGTDSFIADLDKEVNMVPGEKTTHRHSHNEYSDGSQESGPSRAHFHYKLKKA